MSGDTTTSDWGFSEYSFNPSEKLWAKVSRVLYKFSDANRQMKHKDKLREELVREQFQEHVPEAGLLESIQRKIFHK